MTERKLTREEFINVVADHRPEYVIKNNLLLGAERKNKIGFYIETHSKSVYFVIKNTETQEALYRFLHPELVALK